MPSIDFPGEYFCRGCEKYFDLTLLPKPLDVVKVLVEEPEDKEDNRCPLCRMKGKPGHACCFEQNKPMTYKWATNPPKAEKLVPFQAETLIFTPDCPATPDNIEKARKILASYQPSPSFTGGGKPQQPIEYRACEKCQRPFPCSHEFQGKPICYGCFVPTKPERCPLHNPDIAWAPQCEMCSFYEEREWRKEVIDLLQACCWNNPNLHKDITELRRRFA